MRYQDINPSLESNYLILDLDMPISTNNDIAPYLCINEELQQEILNTNNEIKPIQETINAESLETIDLLKPIPNTIKSLFKDQNLQAALQDKIKNQQYLSHQEYLETIRSIYQENLKTFFQGLDYGSFFIHEEYFQSNQIKPEHTKSALKNLDQIASEHKDDIQKTIRYNKGRYVQNRNDLTGVLVDYRKEHKTIEDLTGNCQARYKFQASLCNKINPNIETFAALSRGNNTGGSGHIQLYINRQEQYQSLTPDNVSSDQPAIYSTQSIILNALGVEVQPIRIHKKIRNNTPPITTPTPIKKPETTNTKIESPFANIGKNLQFGGPTKTKSTQDEPIILDIKPPKERRALQAFLFLFSIGLGAYAYQALTPDNQSQKSLEIPELSERIIPQNVHKIFKTKSYQELLKKQFSNKTSLNNKQFKETLKEIAEANPNEFFQNLDLGYYFLIEEYFQSDKISHYQLTRATQELEITYQQAHQTTNLRTFLNTQKGRYEPEANALTGLMIDLMNLDNDFRNKDLAGNCEAIYKLQAAILQEANPKITTYALISGPSETSTTGHIQLAIKKDNKFQSYTPDNVSANYPAIYTTKNLVLSSLGMEINPEFRGKENNIKNSQKNNYLISSISQHLPSGGSVKTSEPPKAEPIIKTKNISPALDDYFQPKSKESKHIQAFLENIHTGPVYKSLDYPLLSTYKGTTYGASIPQWHSNNLILDKNQQVQPFPQEALEIIRQKFYENEEKIKNNKRYNFLNSSDGKGYFWLRSTSSIEDFEKEYKQISSTEKLTNYDYAIVSIKDTPNLEEKIRYLLKIESQVKFLVSSKQHEEIKSFLSEEEYQKLNIATKIDFLNIKSIKEISYKDRFQIYYHNLSKEEIDHLINLTIYSDLPESSETINYNTTRTDISSHLTKQEMIDDISIFQNNLTEQDIIGYLKKYYSICKNKKTKKALGHAILILDNKFVAKNSIEALYRARDSFSIFNLVITNTSNKEVYLYMFNLRSTSNKKLISYDLLNEMKTIEERLNLCNRKHFKKLDIPAEMFFKYASNDQCPVMQNQALLTLFPNILHSQ